MELNLNNSYQIFLENSVNLSKKITYGFEDIESGGVINRVISTIRNFIRWIKKIFYTIYKSIQRKFSLDKSLMNKINKKEIKIVGSSVKVRVEHKFNIHW